MQQRNGDDTRWYTNPWVWLVVSIPSLTVLGCLLTIYLAISNPDVLVKDPSLERTAATRTPREALP